MRAGNVLLFAALMLSACGSSNSVSGSGNTPGPLQPKAQTYYVDANEGNDEADGTSPQKAWRTVARASRQVLKAGDQLLLHRGQTFSGELDIRAEGTKAEPVLVSGYGSGQRPVVSQGQAAEGGLQGTCRPEGMARNGLGGTCRNIFAKNSVYRTGFHGVVQLGACTVKVDVADVGGVQARVGKSGRKPVVTLDVLDHTVDEHDKPLRLVGLPTGKRKRGPSIR